MTTTTNSVSTELQAYRSQWARMMVNDPAYEDDDVLNAAWDLVKEWSEEERDRKGNVRLRTAYKAVATTALNPPTKEEDIMRNPVGFFVKEINWSEEIGSP